TPTASSASSATPGTTTSATRALWVKHFDVVRGQDETAPAEEILLPSLFGHFAIPMVRRIQLRAARRRGHEAAHIERIDRHVRFVAGINRCRQLGFVLRIQGEAGG